MAQITLNEGLASGLAGASRRWAMKRTWVTPTVSETDSLWVVARGLCGGASSEVK